MNAYDVLGIPQNASIDDVRNSYKMKLLSHHPDKNGNSSNPVLSIHEIQTAKNILCDPELRKVHDYNLFAKDLNHDASEKVLVSKFQQNSDLKFRYQCRCGDSYEVSFFFFFKYI
jgi:DnaJ-class molecular chaperone